MLKPYFKIGLFYFNTMSKTYWNYELVKAEALKYKTRTEFRDNACGAYKYARVYKVLDNVCSHMEVVGDKYNRFIYTLIFPNVNSIYIGLTYNFKERKDHHIKNSSNKYIRNLFENNEEHIWEFNQNKIPQNEVGKIEQDLIKKYRLEGWNVLNISNGGGLGGGYKWTDETVKLEALKYDNKKDFRIKSSGAYHFASRKKLLKEICLHMK